MSEIKQKCTLLLSIVIFQFCFFLNFFWIPITFTNFLGRLSSHFFDFWSYMAGKFIFLSSMTANSEKIQKMYTFIVDTSFSILLFFQFFFGFQWPLQTFWVAYRAIFSIFSPIWKKNAFFCVKYSIFLCQSLPKVCFLGENPGHFTKNFSISWRVGTHFEYNVRN